MKLVVKPDIIATKRTFPLQTEAYPLLVNFSSAAGTTVLVDQHSSALMRIFFNQWVLVYTNEKSLVSLIFH